MQKEAKLKIGVEGADRAARELRGVKAAASDLGKGLVGGGLGSFKELGANIRALADDVAKAATGIKSFDFGAAKDRAKGFEEQITRLSLRSGESVGRLSAGFKQVAQDVGVMPERLVETATSFARMTYDGSNAVKMVQDLGDKANDSGRQVEDLLPLATTLRNAFGVGTGDMAKGFDRVRQVAEDLKIAGGERAFQDLIVGLGPQIERLGLTSEKAGNQIRALIGESVKGIKSPGLQREAAAGAVSGPGASPAELIRTLEYNPYDKKTGQIREDLRLKVEEDIRNKTRKRLGGQGGWLAYMNQYGAEEGTRRWNRNYDEVRETARKQDELDTVSATPLRPPDAPLLSQKGVVTTGGGTMDQAVMPRYYSTLNLKGGYRPTVAGLRNSREVEKAMTELGVGVSLARVEDEYQDTFKGARGVQAGVETALGVLPNSAQQVARIGFAGVAGMSASNTDMAQEKKAIADAAQIRILQQIDASIKALPNGTADAIKRNQPGRIVDVNQSVQADKANNKSPGR